AWIVHHGHKTAATINASAEFPALDSAAKAASLLSQLAASDEITISKSKSEALARAAGLNPKLELPPLLDLLERRRVVERSSIGDVAVLGLTTPATVQHAADIFEDLEPSLEERASIVVAELTSAAPTDHKVARELVSDEFKLST